MKHIFKHRAWPCGQQARRMGLTVVMLAAATSVSRAQTGDEFRPRLRLAQTGNPHYFAYGDAFNRTVGEINRLNSPRYPIDYTVICGQLVQYQGAAEEYDAYVLAASQLETPYRSVPGEDDPNAADLRGSYATYTEKTGLPPYWNTSANGVQLLGIANYGYSENRAVQTTYYPIQPDQATFIENSLNSGLSAPLSAVIAAEGFDYRFWNLTGRPAAELQGTEALALFQQKNVSLFLWGSSGSTNTQGAGPSLRLRGNLLDYQVSGLLIHDLYDSHIHTWQSDPKTGAVPKRWEVRSTRGGATPTLMSISRNIEGGIRLPGVGLLEAENYDLDCSAVSGQTAPKGSNGTFAVASLAFENKALNGITAGDWFNYGMAINQTGSYSATLRAASVAGGTLKISFEGSSLYSSISVPATGSVSSFTSIALPAVAFAKGYGKLRIEGVSGDVSLDSLRFRAQETATVATPVLTAPGQTSNQPIREVTLSCATPGATIYYATGGRALSEYAQVYTGPFTISESGPVRAIAIKDGSNASDEMVSQPFVLDYGVSGDLLAYYPFQQPDAVAPVDIINFGGERKRDGTSVGTLSTPIGVLGEGLSFNGTNAYVKWDDLTQYGQPLAELNAAFNARTWAGWVKPSAVNRLQYLWCSDERGGTNSAAFAVRISATGQLEGLVRGKATTIQEVVAATPWPDSGNTWRFVAFSFSNGTLKLWLDGQLKATTTAPYTQIAARGFNKNTQSYLGAGPTRSNLLAGLMDEVRIYGRDLSDAEVNALWLHPRPWAPLNLSATATSGPITLAWTPSWNASEQNVLGYNLYRSTTSGVYNSTPLNASPLSSVNFSDETAQNGTTYFYLVKALNPVGEGAPSNEASASPVAPTPTPIPTVPAPPANLGATAGNAQVSLAWTASSGASGYNVYRGTATGVYGASPVNASPLTSTSFTDTGLQNGTTYFYIVKALNSAGESAASNEASARPVAPASQPVVSNVTTSVPSALSGQNFVVSASVSGGLAPYTVAVLVSKTDTQSGTSKGGLTGGPPTYTRTISITSPGLWNVNVRATDANGVIAWGTTQITINSTTTAATTTTTTSGGGA